MAAMPLFVDGPQYNDVAQGNVGDCYFLAALASLADQDPGTIRQMIAPMGDGTFAVRFYRSGAPVYVRVDGDLPVYSGTSLAYARLSPQGETWVPLAEKAYAELRTGQNTYDSINAGWMGNVYREVTGLSTMDLSTSTLGSSLAQYMSDQLAAGHALTAASSSSPSGPIVGGHAYMVKSVQIGAGGTYITVYNPWGIDGATYDSNPYDGVLQVTLAQFQSSFVALSAAQA
jgi:hypothetical protein